ncbi:MAG: MBL fold metallo-hydrolase [Melioribacteraceae bacterium]|nr:MBL fold metallo-hydrolase [Melioribacteraceae bacterium]
MKRKEFIKKSILASSAVILSPFVLNNNTYSKSYKPLKFKPEPTNWKDNQISLSWIGHSTVLIKFFDKWILTDPVLFERVGVYFFGGSIGPSRLTPPALHFYEFPKPDIILLSHAHMDHMDYPTLKYFSEKYPNQIDVITAYLTKDVIDELPWKSITVIDWDEEKFVQGIRFKANEVQHFGWRFPWEKDRSRGYLKDGRSFNAYLIDYKNRKILFGGDTAYTDKLNKLKNENIEIAIMPIGAYNPWKRNHCNPEEAMKMASDVGAKYFIPIHTKTFKQSNEPFNEAIEWMKRDHQKYNLTLGLTEIGETFSIT